LCLFVTTGQGKGQGYSEGTRAERRNRLCLRKGKNQETRQERGVCPGCAWASVQKKKAW